MPCKNGNQADEQRSLSVNVGAMWIRLSLIDTESPEECAFLFATVTLLGAGYVIGKGSFP